MAASVLGKRSRRLLDAEDLYPSLPARKRRTRCSQPRIYEDAENISNAQITSTVERSAVTSIRSVNTDANKQKRTSNDEFVTNDGNLHESYEDENSYITLKTPTTPRYNNALGAQTPKTLKQRVRLPGSCFPSPQTPRVATPHSRPPCIFGAARQLFTRSSTAEKLIGRDLEREQLKSFISHLVAIKSGGCTYVSGPPGTGKSALVHEVFQDYESTANVEISTVNCVSLKSSVEVYDKLLQDFAPNEAVGKTTAKQFLSKLFLAKGTAKSRLILLDEIDGLLDSNCEVLYTMFELAMHKSSSIILIGIANALDLTDRFLPRLKSRGLKPQLLPFLPYDAAQVSKIIIDKLQSLLPADTSAPEGFVPIMHPTAVQLCSKKIASQTGDLRKAFSLVRRVIDQIERETLQRRAGMTPTKQPLGEILNPVQPNLAGKTNSEAAVKNAIRSDVLPTAFTAESAPRATIAHVAKISASIFNNGSASRLNGLNLQQKAVLCSLVSREKRQVERNLYITPSKSARRVPTMKDLFFKYSTLCQRDEGILQPLRDTEFRDVVASLETLGLVLEYKGRSSMLTPTSTPSRAGRGNDEKQIMSVISEKEMREALTGAGADLLGRLLDEV